MRKAIDIIKKKIEIMALGEETDYRRGFKDALEYAIDVINDCVDSMIAVGEIYYVILYHNGNTFMPYVAEMKLYKMNYGKDGRRVYYFSKNLNANRINTPNPDLFIKSRKSIRDRVFFTREQAEAKIK